MTHYDQLKSAFAQQVAENKIFVEQNIAFAKNIAGDIRAFLDLPEDPPKSDTSKPYMQFLRLDPEKGFEPKDTIAQAVINMPEGKFQFGLGVLLETGIDNFPKQVATFGIACDRNGDRLIVDILGQTFDVAATHDVPLKLGALCQHVFDDLLQELQWRIGDEVEHTRIGFDINSLTS